jgi:hypothetical protein
MSMGDVMLDRRTILLLALTVVFLVLLFGSMADEVEAVPPKEAELPGPPVDVLIIPRANYIEITWKAPLDNGSSDILGYVLYRGLSPDDLHPFMGDFYFERYAWDPFASRGQKFYYAVVAINEVGMGPMSEMVNATAVAVPDQPVDLVAEYVDGEVHLSWSPPNASQGRVGVTGYQVHRGTDPDWLLETFDAGNGTTFVDEDVEDGVTYYYAVGASSELGSSAISGVVEVSTPRGNEVKDLYSFLGFLVFAAAVVTGLIIGDRMTGKAPTAEEGPAEETEPVPEPEAPDEE